MRLTKETKAIDRRDQMAEEFKEANNNNKRARIEAQMGQSMIGQWQEIDQDNSNDY